MKEKEFSFRVARNSGIDAKIIGNGLVLELLKRPAIKVSRDSRMAMHGLGECFKIEGLGSYIVSLFVGNHTRENYVLITVGIDGNDTKLPRVLRMNSWKSVDMTAKIVYESLVILGYEICV